MITVSHAYKVRQMIEKAAVGLEDADALEAVELYPIYKIDTAYHTGDRFRYEDVLYRVLMNHVSQEDWIPHDSPSLYARVLIPDPEVIPVWVQPDSTNPYMAGDKVHFPTAEDDVWISLIDNNVWQPGVYGWELYLN